MSPETRRKISDARRRLWREGNGGGRGAMLPPMTAEQKRLYQKLRSKCGIPREDALREAMR